MSIFVADPDEWLRVNREYNARYNPRSYYWRAQNPSLAYNVAEFAEYGLYGDLANQVKKVSEDLYKEVHRAKVNKSDYVEVSLKKESDMSLTQKRRRFVGPSDKVVGRKRVANTDLTRPDTEVLSGQKIIVGNAANFTSSRKRCRVRTGKNGSILSRALNKLTKTVVWRWQSMYPVNEATANWDRQSLLLNSPTMFGQIGDQNEGKLPHLTALPMYAFDLGTLPANLGVAANSKTKFVLESVPMYRLYKRYYKFGQPPGVALSDGSHNYVWYAQNGYNNGGGSAFEDKSDYLWNQEYSEAYPGNYGAAKQNYTAFDFLFRCAAKNMCKIHVSVVNFKNGTGPDRLFCENQEYDGTENMTTTKYGFEDDNERNDEKTSHRDTFWESFWDSKVTHPLSSFKGKWGNWINFIKDDELQVRPTVDGLVEPYHHKMSYVVGDGGMQSFDDKAQGDFVDSLNQPPVFPKMNQWETNCTFDRAWGYNQQLRYANAQVLYQDNTRDTNPWLLIWMDELRPNENNPVFRKPEGSSEPEWFAMFNRPKGPEAGVDTNCCSFDIRVRKHCTYYRDLY